MSLGFSEIPPIRFFGLFGGIGILSSGLSLFLFTYPLFILFDDRPWPKPKGSLKWIDRITRAASRSSVRHPGLTVGLVFVGSLLLLPQIFKIETETNFFEFFKPNHPISVASDKIENKLSGLSQLRIQFSADNEETLFSPEVLKNIEQVHTWALAQPEINKVISGVDYVKEMNWAFNSGQASFRSIPDSAELIQQYLFVYDGKDLDEFVSPDRTRMISSVSITSHDTQSLGKVIERIKTYLSQMDWPTRVKWEIGGHSKALVDQERLLIQGQLYSLASALFLIWLFMVIQTGSISMGLLCMLPNIAPAMTMFIAMGVFGIHLDMATALVASLVVGIAVDDTIHIVHSLQRNSLATEPQRARSITRALHSTGRSVVSTTLVICSQFAILTSSEFIPSAEYGLLCAISLASALVFDLFLLPALIMVLFSFADKRSLSKRTI